MSLLRLLDVSGIFWPIWRAKEAAGKPVGDAAAETIQALRERAAASGADYVVACCDWPGRTFRHDIALEYRATDPEYRGYKAHRPEKDAAMMACLDRVIGELEADGVPIFRVAGFEADDVIATLTLWARDQNIDVEVVSEDKDLLQLVRDANPDDDSAPSTVVVRRDGTRQDSEACVKRLGVPPQLVAQYLALAGDTSDGVVGIPSVGGGWAVRLLWGRMHEGQWRPSPFRSFQAIVDAAIEDQAAVEQSDRERAEAKANKVRPLPPEYKPKFPENVRKSLIANGANFGIGLRLTALRTDVPLDFAAVTAPRVPKPKDTGFQVNGYEEDDHEEKDKDDIMTDDAAPLPPMGQTQQTITPEAPPSAEVVSGEIVPPSAAVAQPAQTAAALAVHVAPPPRADLAVREIQQVTEQAIARSPGAYSLSLDPRDFKEARMLAKDVFDARIFPKIKSPQQALALIMTGREYGLPAMASLRLIHEIEGQMAIHAQVKIGLAMKSPRVEFMDIVDWHDDGERSYCVWRGKRRGRKEENVCKYSVEHARAQGLVKPNSNWVKMPAWMSMVRSGANLATILIPDEMAGLYTFDEMGAAEPMIVPAGQVS